MLQLLDTSTHHIPAQFHDQQQLADVGSASATNLAPNYLGPECVIVALQLHSTSQPVASSSSEMADKDLTDAEKAEKLAAARKRV